MADLAGYLAKHADPAVAGVILALAGAASAIAAEIRMPATSLDEAAGAVNADGDTQKKLDVIADDIVLEALEFDCTSNIDSEVYLFGIDKE